MNLYRGVTILVDLFQKFTQSLARLRIIVGSLVPKSLATSTKDNLDLGVFTLRH
jgi:hypothetical protein